MKLPPFQKKPESFLVRNSANIFLFAGMEFFVLALYLFLSQYLFMKKAQMVIGKVISYEIPKSKTLRVPVIEYRSLDNHTHIFRHTEGTNPPTYRIGEQVKIYYNPLENEDVILGFSFIPLIILMIFGTFFTIIGFAMKQ